jgi:hypothetical protein
MIFFPTPVVIYCYIIILPQLIITAMAACNFDGRSQKVAQNYHSCPLHLKAILQTPRSIGI